VRPSPEETTSVLVGAVEDSVCEVPEGAISDEPDPDSEVGGAEDPVVDEAGAEVAADEDGRTGAEAEGVEAAEEDGEVTSLQERS